MKTCFFASAVIAFSITLSSCKHVANEQDAPQVGTVDAIKTAPKPKSSNFTELDPLGLGGEPVSFERRPSNACPGTEGRAEWHAVLNGIRAVSVTYGVKSKGADTGQRGTFSLEPNNFREVKLFCAGDGESLDFEPFVIEVEATW